MNNIKLWTIQTEEAFLEAKKNGFLRGNQKYIDTDFISAYSWMMQQMKIHLEEYKGGYPVWLWIKRPDLRNSGHLKKQKIGLLIEVELPPSKILISDFFKWHSVLNNQFCYLDEKEEVVSQNEKIYLSKEESWKRIFIINNDELNSNKLLLQGVCEEISLKNIKSITQFIAR